MKSLTWMLIPFFLVLQYGIWFAPGGVASLWRVHQQLAAETAINPAVATAQPIINGGYLRSETWQSSHRRTCPH